MAFSNLAPINQLNALPSLFFSGAGTTPPSTIVPAGGKVIKTWLPAESGINGQSSNVADPRSGPGFGVYLITNWLDFTGMSQVTLMLGVEITTAVSGDPLPSPSWSVRAIPMTTANGVVVDPLPSLPGGTGVFPDTLNLTGTYGDGAFPQVGTLPTDLLGGLVFPGGPYYKLSMCGWGPSSNGAGTFQAVPVMGPMKLWLSSAAGADPAFNYLTVIASS